MTVGSHHDERTCHTCHRGLGIVGQIPGFQCGIEQFLVGIVFKTATVNHAAHGVDGAGGGSVVIHRGKVVAHAGLAQLCATCSVVHIIVGGIHHSIFNTRHEGVNLAICHHGIASDVNAWHGCHLLASHGGGEGVGIHTCGGHILVVVVHHHAIHSRVGKRCHFLDWRRCHLFSVWVSVHCAESCFWGKPCALRSEHIGASHHRSEW